MRCCASVDFWISYICSHILRTYYDFSSKPKIEQQTQGKNRWSITEACRRLIILQKSKPQAKRLPLLPQTTIKNTWKTIKYTNFHSNHIFFVTFCFFLCNSENIIFMIMIVLFYWGVKSNIMVNRTSARIFNT